MSSNTELPPFGNDELARNFTLRDLYVRASISGSNRGSTSSPQSLNISKENSRTSVSESASNAAVGSEGSVLSTAKVPSNYEESVPSGEIVTIHVGSASSNATANGSGLASCSISNSALRLGNWRVFQQFYRRALGYDLERHDEHLLRDQLGQHLCRDNEPDVPLRYDGAPTQGQGIVKALQHSSRFSTTLMVE